MLTDELVSFVYNTFSNVTPRSCITEDLQFIEKCRLDIIDLKRGMKLFPHNKSIYESEILELEETIMDLQKHIEEMKIVMKEYGPDYILHTNITKI